MEYSPGQRTLLSGNACAVQTDTTRSDPFFAVNGHYVGHDGFSVPANFGEFYDRFPDYILKWVKRHSDPRTPKEDLEDWAQDLTLHMSSLPSKSKYRVAGLEDVI